MKKLILTVVLFTGLLIVLPALLVLFYSGTSTHPLAAPASDPDSDTISSYQDEAEEYKPGPEVVVPVYREGQDKVEDVELEDYVAGVVSAEMPAAFEMEALKAQALVARTFVVKQMKLGDDESLPEDAIVTDTTSHQVFKNEEEWEQEWGAEAEDRMEKINSAVEATAGEIITYDGSPITASFFSTSNGHTENAEEYWETSLPYLQSVESPWDVGSPRYENTKRYPVAEIEQRLGVSIPEGTDLQENIERTEGNRIASVTIGNTTFHGREIRELLELDSSDFEWQREGEEIVIHTKGWGHGVGMSQYGADGMAKEGNNYRQIVDHYYQDVEIAEDSSHMEAYVLNDKDEETES
ncbi:stage II sporulation protein D [Geomicrobium halophilum]|uniref:Stage II sporulation protein D n=1 Tax=Geomicrobium halophilum TaxID=549000 RepID=A0A841PZW6_9BACL|nr:stage II sporulation protein D [Geomicrobium halophilum]MBB6450452.1 stage II sporulation protein D [Geomicrobium halophilum]